MKLLIYCDGAVEPKNPGGWGVGGWLVKDTDGKRLAEGARDLGCYPEMTNNVAEYGAVKAALDHVVRKGWQLAEIVVRTDSLLVVNQLNDMWRCHSPTLRKLRDEVWAVLECMNDVSFMWIPREDNREADAMSRSLYKPEYRDVQVDNYVDLFQEEKTI